MKAFYPANAAVGKRFCHRPASALTFVSAVVGSGHSIDPIATASFGPCVGSPLLDAGQ